MKTRWLVVCVLIGCSSSDSNGPTDSGANTDTSVDDGRGDTFVNGPVDVQIDTYNLGLAGAGVPAYAERRPVLLQELAKLTGDIACFQEAWEQTDKDAIVAAMKPHYPYAHSVKTSLATKVDDPTDKDGKVPPAPGAPCAGLETALEAGVACLAKNCSSIPGSADGKVTDLDCAKSSCVADVASLLGASDKSCYTCLATNLPSEPIKEIETNCEAPAPALGFSGQSSPLLVSKHPLDDFDALVVPGCWQQRVVIKATATLNNGAKVDVYCNHLSSVTEDVFIPYTCAYGGDATTEAGQWEQEQLLQAQKIVAWATSKSKGKVVFLGDLNASPKTSDPTIDVYGAATFDLLAKTYAEALPAGYEPQCTYCKTNWLTGETENTWLDHVFLGGIDKSATRSAAVTFREELVDTPKGKKPKSSPSDHYGMRVVVTVPQ